MTNTNNTIGSLTGQLKSPRTILGFFAALMAILGTTTFALVSVLVDIESLQGLIPILLIFGACFFSFISLAILITSWIKPEKLMLGEVKGEVYLQMLQLHQGDSEAGDVIENIPFQSVNNETDIKTLGDQQNSKEDDSNV